MDVICDLVLLSWNHVEETKPCLETLFESTEVPARLFIVDNGSKPEVRAFLQGVRPRGHIAEVILLQNERNEGFPKGMNRGIRASTAPFVCLLNNDLLFTQGWLQEMIAVANARPEIGVVNPASSTLGNHPPRGTSLQEYADNLRLRHGVYTEVGMCIGFCMLVKRAVIDRLGGLSEEVDRIFFEDEDFCMQAQQAGFQSVVAAAAFVYHGEHKTVRDLPEREMLFTKNRRWCEEKWGRWIRIAWPRFAPVVPGSPELRQWLERLLAWARRRAYIHVFAPMPAGMTQDSLFRSVGLIPHADIHWYAIRKPFVPLAAMGSIVARRKKPIDLIAAPKGTWAESMRRLRWVHHAEVIAQGEEAELVAQWQQKAHPVKRASRMAP